MSSPEPTKEPDRQIELNKVDEIPVPTEIKKHPRFIYIATALPIIIFVSVNLSCLGVTYSNFSCLSILIILVTMFLVPRLSRSLNRRIKLLSLCALLSVFPFGLCMIPLFDPIHGPNSWTDLYLLRLTPPGTSRNDVQELIAKKGWKGQPKWLQNIAAHVVMDTRT